MKLEFLHKSDSRRLILIMAGWSTDSRFYADVHMPGWDTAAVSGADTNAPDFEPLKSYDTIYLYAWSMGVYWAMSLLPQWLSPAACYAIAGTPTPCHDSTGIPEAVFEGTARTLNERNLLKFRKRMCGARYCEVAGRFEAHPDIEALALQLLAVKNDRPALRKLPWRAAYIGSDDRIFPPENQRRAWTGITEIRELQAPHLIDLQDIVVHTIIDTSKVGERFTRSLDTYSSHAHAQRIIAENLAAMLAGSAPADCREVIELGSGTGLFTRAWSRLLNPQRARFFDLCRMPVYGVCEREEYFTGDAEQAVAQLAADQPLSVDAILSASAIQWFANHQRFFSNCHRLLKPEGLLAISTFAPGNLPELCRLRPDPMYYPSAETIRSYLSDFQRVEVRQEEVEIDFTSPMEALRHLRLTGVTGSGAQAGAAGVRRFVREYPQNSRGRYSLTFKPIYILARK